MPGQRSNREEPLEAGLLAAFSLLAIAGRKSLRGKLRGMVLLGAVTLAVLTLGMTGCGGGGSSTPASANTTPKGSYTLHVTASASTGTASLNLTVNVQ